MLATQILALDIGQYKYDDVGRCVERH